MTVALYKSEVKEEDGNLVINIPEEIMEKTGWNVGDSLEWIIHDTYVILRKAPDENSSIK
jgi:bifunctional DNA-binding transcriptional regulator/antitoxin component of YhaV-PrlF toxin-antitoxin module